MNLHVVTMEERKSLQESLLRMLLDFDYVCNKHGIHYMLAGGTELGAVRHHGFIPWDDDLDIMMPRADYERFKNVFVEEMADKYDMSAPNTNKVAYSFMKLYKKGITCKETLDGMVCDNLWIDVFPIDYVSNYKLERFFKGICADFLNFVGASLLISQHRNKLTIEMYSQNYKRKLRYYIAVFLSNIIPISSTQVINLFDKFVQGNRSEYMTIPTGDKRYYNGAMKECVFNCSKMELFEGFYFPISEYVDLHLDMLYGDYMRIPPVEKRGHHYIAEFKIDDGVEWIVP